LKFPTSSLDTHPPDRHNHGGVYGWRHTQELANSQQVNIYNTEMSVCSSVRAGFWKYKNSSAKQTNNLADIYPKGVGVEV